MTGSRGGDGGGPPMTLTARLSFHLRLAHEAVQQSFAAALIDTGLAPVHAEALTLIGAHPGIKPSELAEALGRDRSSITAALHVLQQHHLVDRTATTRDRRATLLHLTDAGQQILAIVNAIAAEQERLLDQALGAEDRPGVIAALHRMRAALAPGGTGR